MSLSVSRRRKRESGGLRRLRANKTRRPSTTAHHGVAPPHLSWAAHLPLRARTGRGAGGAELAVRCAELRRGEVHCAARGRERPRRAATASLCARASRRRRRRSWWHAFVCARAHLLSHRLQLPVAEQRWPAVPPPARRGQTATADGRGPAPDCVSLAADGRCAPRRAGARAARHRPASPPRGGGRHSPISAQGGPLRSAAVRLPRYLCGCERSSWLERVAARGAGASWEGHAGRSCRARRHAPASARQGH